VRGRKQAGHLHASSFFESSGQYIIRRNGVFAPEVHYNSGQPRSMS
jgi:hypothetical protein